MATLLYRLGLGAARRPLLVILAWVLALALAVGGFLAFGGTLSSTVTIPGTPTAQVTDRLKEEFPEASRGRGQVVFTTEDGSPLTDAQREQITALLDDVAEQPAVEGVVDPFEAQAQQDDARTRLDEGRTELADGELTGTVATSDADVRAAVALPAVAGLTEKTAEPRFPNFKNIMAAKKKPLTVLSLADLGIAAGPAEAAYRSVMVSADTRPERAAGEKVTDDGTAAERLVEFLAGRGLV